MNFMEEMAADAETSSGPSDVQLRMIAKLARRQRELERKVERAEKLFDARKAQLNEVKRRQLPELLREVGLAAFTLSSGAKITVKDEYQANISEANRDAAMRWLIDNGHDGLIKNSVAMQFARGEESDARRALEVLQRAGFAATQTRTVHPQTLKAFAKEQQLDKDEVAKKLFGVYVDKVATVKG